VIETLTTGLIDTLLYCINHPSSHCFYHWVDTSTGELLVLECINHPSSQCFYHWVDTSTGGLVVPVIETLTTGLIDTLQY
jgi:disulfide oxidoreductase YuzD